MPLPPLPQQPSVRSAGPARSGAKVLLFDADASGGPRPLKKEVRR